jgi:hypothetical protein
MVRYVHIGPTMLSIWDPQFKTVWSQSDMVFDKEWNAYILRPKSLSKSYRPVPREAGDSEINEMKRIDKIDIFVLPWKEIHNETVDKHDLDDPRSMHDRMIHGRTQMSETGCTLLYCHTGSEFEETTGFLHDSNTTSQTNWQRGRSCPAADMNTGQNHTH